MDAVIAAQQRRHRHLRYRARSWGGPACTSFNANQLRVLLTAAAYVLYQELRCRITARDEVRAQVGTLRLQLIKIGGRIVQSVRRVVVHLATNHPWRER